MEENIPTANADTKFYKVLNPSASSPSVKFDYSPYLPSDGVAGEWLPEIPEAKIREEGYYASEYWNFWLAEGDRIYEIEARGIVADPTSEVGVRKQICCRQIRLLRDVTDELRPLLSRGGKFNIGAENSGRGNIGDKNTGEYNLGSRNTGKLNRGDFNTGDSNEGIDNVGDFNIGSGNVGSRNRGHSNTGDNNVGSYNSGTANLGNKNAGSFNIGSGNVGHWNCGDGMGGLFNTCPQTLVMFDKPVEGLKQSDIVLPKWLNLKAPPSRENIRKSFDNASKADAEKTLSLPNFDYEIFEKITGVSREDFDAKLSSE